MYSCRFKCVKVSTTLATHAGDKGTTRFPVILEGAALHLDGVERRNYTATHSNNMPTAMVTLKNGEKKAQHI